MATTEDRVSKLELAQSATSDALTRLERKVGALDQKADAMHRVIAESEVRLKAEMTASELRLGAKVSESEQRLENRLSGIDQRVAAAQRETAGLLNDLEQRILAAIDKLANPPK